MNQVSNSGPPKKRLGGRTTKVTNRVRQAIIDLLIEGGFDACTFSAVAQRAGIERSTLYRRYPDRWEAIIDACLARAADAFPDLQDSFADDLTAMLRRLVDVLESPFGLALVQLAATHRAQSGMDYSQTYFDQRMEQLNPIFDAAIRRGEIRAGTDREALFTEAAGPIYFRLFLAGREVDEDFIQSIVSNICRLYCSPGMAAKPSLTAHMA